MEKMVIVTHGGKAHADDLFAVALVVFMVVRGIFRPFSSYKIDRLPNSNVRRTFNSDITIDIGRIYDPELDYFDHHQYSFQMTRDNGVPYASFGLVWKKYGALIVKYYIDEYYPELVLSLDVDEIVTSFDERFIQPIDDADVNGSTSDMDKMRDYTIQRIIRSFDFNGRSHDETFQKDLLPFAEKLIENELRKTIESSRDAKIVLGALDAGDTTCEGKALFLPKRLPFQRALVDTDVLLVLYPEAGKWRAQTTLDSGGNNRFLFPQKWRGFAKKELEEKTGIPDLLFCHGAGFTAGAKTKDALEKMVQLAFSS